MRSPLLLLLLAMCGVLAGCDKSVDVGANYTIAAPFSPDGQNHGNTLLYKNKEVCKNVVMQAVNDDTLVFMSGVRSASDEQLMAVRGPGPAVMLSERVLNRSLATSWPYFELTNLVPAGDGFDADFVVDVDKTSADVHEMHHLSWAQINGFLDEAKQSARLMTARQGTFYLLPMKAAAATK